LLEDEARAPRCDAEGSVDGQIAAPTLTAVVVTHNSAEVIDSCLRSLRAQLSNAELIVVDNASTDATRVRCQEFSELTLLENPANLGFGRACNQGAQSATGSHVLFVNPDARLVEAKGSNLWVELTREPFGLIGPLFLRDGARAAPLLLPDRPWPMDVLMHALGPLRPREFPSLPKIPVRRKAWWPGGAVLLAARAEFLSLGGFRPEFFLYYEDRDLARRYRAAGLPVGTTRSIIAQHTPGSSSASDDSLRIAANGWAYLGWIEYLSCWYGDATARRAVLFVHRLQVHAYRMLARLESRGRLSDRVVRKRMQLSGVGAFIRLQSAHTDGAADAAFCPHARKIIAELDM
jgi:N-acetylglucosaminyl-diphospho-decaprenol L-rhamnosyltransferase